MAEKTVKVSVIVDDDGTLRLTEKSAQRLGNTLKKTGKSAQTLDRRLKGAAQASSNTSKNFAKQAQGITGGLVPAYATLAANIFAITAAFGFFKRAADLTLLEQSQQQFAASTGIGLKRISEGLQEASDGMLTFQKASEAAAIGVAKGFSPAQLESLAQGARKASAALGRDFEDSFDRLVRGVSKAEPELLDELGITLRLETATKNYAQSIDKAAKSLNSYEKSQAVLLEVQKQLDRQFASFEPSANVFVRLQVTFDKIVKQFTKGILPAAEALARVLNESPGTAIVTFGALGLSIAKAALPLEDFKNDFNELGSGATKALDDVNDRIATLTAEIQRASINADELLLKAQQAAQGASGDLASQTQSKFAQRLAAGEKLQIIDVKRFDKDLARVEKEIRENGKVIKGVYKGASLDAVLAVRQALAEIVVANQQAAKQAGTSWEIWSLKFKKVMAETKARAISTFKAIGRSAASAGRLAGKVLRFAGTISFFLILKDLVVGAISNLESYVKSVLSFFDNFSPIIKAVIGNILNIFIIAAEGLLRIANALGIAEEKTAMWADALKKSRFDVIALYKGQENLNDSFSNSPLGKIASDFTESQKAQEKAKKTLEKYNSELESFSEAYDAVSKALTTGTQLQRANSLVTLNASSLLRKAAEARRAGLLTEEQALEGLDAQYKPLVEVAKQFGVVFKKPLTVEQYAQLIPLFETLEARGSAAIGTFSAFKNSAETLGQELGSFKAAGTNFTGVLQAIRAVDREIQSSRVSLGKLAGDSEDYYGELQNLTGLSIGEIRQLEARIASLNVAEEKRKDNLNNLAKLELQSSRLVSKSKELFTDRIKLLKEEAKLQELNIKLAANGLAQDIEKEPVVLAGLRDQQAEIERAISLQRERIAVTKEEINQFNKLNLVIGESLVSNLENAIKSFVRGEQSFRDSLLNLAQGVAKAVADFTTKILALQILKGILPEELQVKLGIIPDPADYEKVGDALAEAMTKPEYTSKYSKAVEDPLKKQNKALQDNGKKLNTDLMNTFDKASRMLFKAISEACRGCKCSETATSDSITETVVKVAAETATNQASANQGPLNQKLSIPTGGTFEGYTLPSPLDAIRGDQPFFEKKPEGADEFTMFPKEEKKGFFDGLKDIFGSFKTKLGEIFAPEGGFLNKLGGIFKGALDGIGSFFSGLFGGGGAGAGGGGGVFSTILQGVMSIFGFAMGGVAQGGFRAYANGGVVSKPTLGLVGEGKMNEAIVPLPDGKSIPVMGSTSSQTNNVNVSVAVNNEGQAQTTVQQDSQNGANLGRLIASVVQEELQTQKRPGGLLSPYGAA